jgi:hypothetical protein
MQPIIVRYTQSKADWAIEVIGPGQTLTARAAGIVAGRTVADHLIQQIAPADQPAPRAVHLLNGSAVEFSRTYLTARLSVPVTAPSTNVHHRAAAAADDPVNPPQPASETTTGSDADATNNTATSIATDIDQSATTGTISNAAPSAVATTSKEVRRDPRGETAGNDDQLASAGPQRNGLPGDQENAYPNAGHTPGR